MITHRNLGLAYLEESKLLDARDEFLLLVEIAPREPLGYANLGLTYLRMAGGLGQAEKWLQKALRLEPDHPDIRLLLAQVHELTSRKNQAIHTLENTLKKHPNHVRTLYQLAQYYLAADDPATRQQAVERLILVVNIVPANVAASLQLVELLVQYGKPLLAVQHLETIRQILPELPAGALEIFRRSLELMRDDNAEQAAAPARIFHNLMRTTSFYQAALTELRGTGGPIAGLPIYRFSQLVSLPIQERTGLPDGLNFTEVTAASGLDIISSDGVAESSDDYPQIVLALGDYNGDGNLDVFVARWLAREQASRQYLFANDNGSFSDVAAEAGISHAGRDLSAIFADYDNDGHQDLFVTNTRGSRLYHNSGAGAFGDVTAAAGIRTDPTIVDRAALFADLDLEGDLDLFIVSSSKNRLYRNNSDGTFTEIAEEVGIGGGEVISRAAGFGDFDDDGDIDLFVVNQDAGIRFYDNLRRSYFRDITEHTGLPTDGGSGAVAVGDYNNDGYLDLFVTGPAGGHSLFANRGDGTFERDSRSDGVFESIKGLRGLDAAFFDADNDGYLDLIVAGTSADTAQNGSGLRLFYNNGRGKFLDASSLLPTHLEACSQVEVADYDNDGDLDIFLAGFQGIHLLRNDGGNVNNYLVIRLAGLRTGSGKNNYFGIGAKVEVKAGSLYQMRLMSGPMAHFGLGDREGADLVRVIWTNGVSQNRFNPEKNQTIMEYQILKGSCPFLYTWDGDQFTMVTDVHWRSAIGMPLGIMSGEVTYGFANSADEYFKVPGRFLQPRDGLYLLQFTEELWETAYLDEVNLVVVDHPDSVEIYIDEQFTLPPFSPPKIHTVAQHLLPRAVTDQSGRDLLPKVMAQDELYIGGFQPTRYQGVVNSHDLIIDLGQLQADDEIVLFLEGWIFPTDASINVAIGQSSAQEVIQPYLQVPDETGAWRTVVPFVGFPKGKNKMVIVDLTGKFTAADYRVRLRTNMQIYWDRIFFTANAPSAPTRETTLNPLSADIHYRGFSQMYRKGPDSPHWFDYREVSTEPLWRDLVGDYTRYGDVTPLLTDADNRYVIINAGDEVSLKFDAGQVPPLPAGWTRDFLFYSDGWLKDGDLSTAHGQTVGPLPFHGMTSYPYGPDESYPGDEKHMAYRQQYNTRAVTAEGFKRFLFNFHDDE
ncbi:MAG: VCBS repeat-containing protein [Candidatus Marinimicrobia bacterium]|nr:VCBS repeat-containing protein [Candidatus Neomarinimicrobiota bacterium]